VNLLGIMKQISVAFLWDTRRKEEGEVKERTECGNRNHKKYVIRIIINRIYFFVNKHSFHVKALIISCTVCIHTAVSGLQNMAAAKIGETALLQTELQFSAARGVNLQLYIRGCSTAWSIFCSQRCRSKPEFNKHVINNIRNLFAHMSVLFNHIWHI
jgi:hypothetical protein